MRAASLCGRTERSLPRRSESSWLLAQNELQKINQYKAPRDKLVCVLNCCRIINNLLSASASTAPPVRAAIALPRLRRSRRAPVQGADDFLPVLVLVLLRAAPTQLASNLAYIARFRLASRLVSETSYFYTNLVSAAVRALAGLAAAQGLTVACADVSGDGAGVAVSRHGRGGVCGAAAIKGVHLLCSCAE